MISVNSLRSLTYVHPSEFAEDHLPGAVNLPVLDDEERATVGTIYKGQAI